MAECMRWPRGAVQRFVCFWVPDAARVRLARSGCDWATAWAVFNGKPSQRHLSRRFMPAPAPQDLALASSSALQGSGRAEPCQRGGLEWHRAEWRGERRPGGASAESSRGNIALQKISQALWPLQGRRPRRRFPGLSKCT